MKTPLLVILSFLPCVTVLAGDLSPAEQKIQAARAAIQKNPQLARPRTELAFALSRRARETADASLYDQAIEAAAEALKLEPESFEALKARVWALLGKHEFAAAAEEARKLNLRSPDDLLVYGFLGDAYTELGDYARAEEAVQWMLDLRPGNVPGITRAAYLRELFGDIEGAIELMAKALQRTQPSEVEDRAWILTQLGHLELARGKVEAAEVLLGEALQLFPNYHYALAQLARARLEQKRPAEAVELLEKRYAGAPHPENLFELAEALKLAGRNDEASKAFLEFEKSALKESKGWDNANRELVLYYVDHAGRPGDGLRLAETEAARRQDVHTLEVLAWAQHAVGRKTEARTTMEKALAVGSRDPRLLRHAAVMGVVLTSPDSVGTAGSATGDR